MPPNVSPKDDPSVRIPAAVRAAAANAEALQKRIYNPEPEPPAEPGNNPPIPGETQVTSPGNPETPETHAETQVTQPDNTRQQPAEPPAEPDQPVDWEHRYNSMKGRWQRDTKLLSDRLADLEGVIANMQTVPPRAAAAPAGQPEPEVFLTQKEIDEYGPEFIEVVGRKASEVAAPLLKQIKDLEARINGVSTTVVKDAKQKLYEYLDVKLPQWRELNDDPRFISWLKLPDDYSGAIRHTLMMRAFEQHDAPRVLRFFNGFLADEVADDPAKQPDPPQARAAKVPLETFAAPGKAKTAAASAAPAEKPILTRPEISAFYLDVQRGKYRGRDAERDAFEKRIFEAQRSGRIR
jgi:hypothetical protein